MQIPGPLCRVSTALSKSGPGADIRSLRLCACAASKQARAASAGRMHRGLRRQTLRIVDECYTPHRTSLLTLLRERTSSSSRPANLPPSSLNLGTSPTSRCSCKWSRLRGRADPSSGEIEQGPHFDSSTFGTSFRLEPFCSFALVRSVQTKLNHGECSLRGSSQNSASINLVPIAPSLGVCLDSPILLGPSWKW